MNALLVSILCLVSMCLHASGEKGKGGRKQSEKQRQSPYAMPGSSGKKNVTNPVRLVEAKRKPSNVDKQVFPTACPINQLNPAPATISQLPQQQ